MMTKKLIVFILYLFICGCFENKNYSKTIPIQDSFFRGEVIVEKITKLAKYRISIYDSLTGKRDRIYTPFEIFQMNTGDVNRDGKTDICIGIIKNTPFDPELKKRLFIFQIDRDYIRPLWLSSRLVKPLEEFSVCIVNKNCTIKTIEKENNDLYCVNEYSWGSFGMVFLKEMNNSLTYSEAKYLLNN